MTAAESLREKLDKAVEKSRGVLISWELSSSLLAELEAAEQALAKYERVKDSCVCFWCGELFPYPRQGTREEQASALTAHAMSCLTNPIHHVATLEERVRELTKEVADLKKYGSI